MTGRRWLRNPAPDLEAHYLALLQRLGTEEGLLGLIFRKAQNRIQDPSKLRRLIVDLIDQETWSGVDADVKGDAYEGLLEKNASDTKSGAGQYFTPRPLTWTMTEVMQPRPGQTIADPACGTGGFLLSAFDYITHPGRYQLDRDAVALPARPHVPRQRNRGQHRAPVRHEPVPSRHRRRRPERDPAD